MFLSFICFIFYNILDILIFLVNIPIFLVIFSHFSAALPVALAAHRMNRPIRCMLDRDEDMMITGTRHPFLIKYKVSFNNDGKMTGSKIKIYNNAGYSLDLSHSVSRYYLQAPTNISGLISQIFLNFNKLNDFLCNFVVLGVGACHVPLREFLSHSKCVGPWMVV